MAWLAVTVPLYICKRHNIEIIIKVIINNYIKIVSYYNTVACDFAVLCQFYNTFNLTENTHVSHKSLILAS